MAIPEEPADVHPIEEDLPHAEVPVTDIKEDPLDLQFIENQLIYSSPTSNLPTGNHLQAPVEPALKQPQDFLFLEVDGEDLQVDLDFMQGAAAPDISTPLHPYECHTEIDAMTLSARQKVDEGSTHLISAAPYKAPKVIDIQKLELFAAQRTIGILLRITYFGADPNKLVSYSRTQCTHWPVLLQRGRIMGELCALNHIYKAYNQAQVPAAST
ncbi:uncharacterized protein K452DRAFT_311985 [Aplosporella prunicola CBS 121167]|uniref:Uncharacterized protein n=1 Tax=Aplosporella prunicola CBS 121167 TaxID=1176127 RepID=A0A6A6B203_9PEZI|nr:uncharacterized protein K452DRAFT_311985 [Aplosporella prunicola CBS 121167]KAF2137846.1 hypothetical protein K452DRAFT_311985 [Aplosporella prunicola CBS 121167]